MTDRPAPPETLFRFFTEVSIIAQLAGRSLEAVLPAGLTLSQFAVLNHLSRLERQDTPAALAAALQVSRGTMTNTLGHLERAGHVMIAPDDHDGRSKRVGMTPAGAAVHAAARAAMGPELAAIAAAIPAASFAEALPFLGVVRRLLDERRS